MDHLKTVNPKYGYNRNPKAGSMLGFRHSEETKRLVGEKGKGRRHTEDTKKRISERMKIVMVGNKHFKGHKHTEEAKKKIAAASRKQWNGAYPYASSFGFKDKKHTKLSKEAIANAAKEQWRSEEHRKNVAAKNREATNRQFADPEHREKHRLAMVAWAQRRVKAYAC